MVWLLQAFGKKSHWLSQWHPYESEVILADQYGALLRFSGL